MSQRTIGVTEVALRDAHQSLMATRMALEDMVDACADIDAAGFWSVECWGGATYDACIRFLNEDPWKRLRTFRELLPNSRLQMLLRGQNLLGYRHYEDMVVEKFVEKSAENGMDVFRVFDSLQELIDATIMEAFSERQLRDTLDHTDLGDTVESKTAAAIDLIVAKEAGGGDEGVGQAVLGQAGRGRDETAAAGLVSHGVR